MMERNFNQLKLDEAERLAMLIEEAGQVTDIASKILRHGYESYHPSDPSTTNREILSEKVFDFLTVVTMMEPDFDPTIGGSTEDSILHKLKYTHHQGQEK